ncbi:MAG TPA: hypothetical protein VF929_06695 [Gemmatimonadaceae bacterium]
MRLVHVAGLALLVSLTARKADAQLRDTTNVLPRDVAQEVVALFNATQALRTTTRLVIDSSRTVLGDVAVLNGPVMIAGHVTGRVLAINADVILTRGARIEGDLLVVGGEVEGLRDARIGGEIRVYHPPLRYAETGDQLTAVVDEGAEYSWWQRWEHARRHNFNRLDIATAGVYNRVEGLPVRIGPVLYRDQGWGHVRLDATTILRTASSFAGSTPDVGHDVHTELRIGRQYGVSLGGRLFQVVQGVEEWQLSNVEVGLATFLFHRDYRDYFGRHGGLVSAALRATDNADLTFSYSDERWRSLDAHEPLTLWQGDGDRGWRQNPHVDDGRFHVANLTLRVDTRNDDFNPWAGWYVLADFERGAGRIDALGPASSGVRASALLPTRYQRGFVDVRRYNRLAPSAALNLRLVMGGWLSGDPLPLERRLSIDGPGTVPGFDFRVSDRPDVGTCSAGVPLPGRPAECERVALAQLEYRNDLRISYSAWEDGQRVNQFRADGAWVFFADAGRGWTVNAPGGASNYGRKELPPLGTYRTDIGAGVDFEKLGIYLAKAVSTPKEPLNVFIRVRHRF